ncbi:ATP-dependent nuclease [Parerythrobacter aestuarii]|uniref:ATP-dependent nuclease n=1 Tax=Parerythrobacter aestuarii TaxID=3020909 RepID=UPI0024DE313D|nr:AAA family ATPase [Parerythrobacter aestuarii]
MPKHTIQTIHLRNFKGFRNRKIEGLDASLNIFIGDNDTGKSSILQAIDLVLGANTSRVDAIGLEKLINQSAVSEFLSKQERKVEDLPEMEIDLYLSDTQRPEFDGQHNIEQIEAHGIYLRCRPRDELFEQISEVIKQPDIAFPYDYYMVEIKGFGGEALSPYKKPLDCLVLDTTKISTEYASKAYINTMYQAHVKDEEKHALKYAYRQVKDSYSKEQLAELNERLDAGYGFSVKNSSKANLETDLTISREGIDIDNLGMGSQCFVRTEFALAKKANIDVVLLEEPENHLSQANMKRLIKVIEDGSESQIFIATHSSLICSRLDLRHAILLGPPGAEPIKLDALPKDTAEFFMRAPDNSVLEFVLSSRALLVEGDAEYILMEAFYQNLTGEPLFGSGVDVIAIGGISFPRYLDIAKLLGIRTVVITDNDGNGQTTCVERYEPYADAATINVAYDPDDARSTFEICVYQDNSELCEGLFAEGRRTLTVQEYMLKNKSEAAFAIASSKPDDVVVPAYIAEAITWIRS